MKERPILFSGEMVRALIEGRKTQTRRVVTPPNGYRWLDSDVGTMINDGGHKKHISDLRCKFGEPKDRLWVRETWKPDIQHEISCLAFRADNYVRYLKSADEVEQWFAARKPEEHFPQMLPAKWRPSIFMPRWASRIDLEITGVRVERLSDISDIDALSEGVLTVRSDEFDKKYFSEWKDLFDMAVARGEKPPIGPSPRDVFRALWESINGAGSWELNPWVWVLDFVRVEKTN